ncbi:MAG: NAD-dependent epimerase/dehydratase family protein [Phycisphaerales bacterium]
MSITRRDFVKLGVAAGAAAAVVGVAGRARAATKVAQPVGKAVKKPLKILILGGTAFLGPAVVDACKARGHSVTIFNRGKTEKRIGAVEGVEHLYGNRDPEKRADDADEKSPKGLSELEKGEWDVVVDTSGFVPRIVDASAKLLAPRVKQYIFISSVSAFARNDIPNQDESGAVGKMANETDEQVSGGNYGPLKALCEKAAEDAMPGRVTNIRPGYIVGPGDGSDRFTYWPVRASKGGEMLAPGTPSDPVQIVDVRDLAAFIVRCSEKRTMGVINVVGPVKPTTWGEVLGVCVTAAKAKGTEPKLTWVEAEFLEEQGIEAGSLPIWIPPAGEYKGFHLWSNAKAVAAGLTTRPTAETCRDLLVWWPKEVERRTRVGKELTAAAEKEGKPAPKLGDPEKPRAGIPAEKEAAVLKAWKDRKPAEKKDEK